MSWTGSGLLDAPVLVRTAEEKAARKAYNNVDAIYAADQAGEPCACGTDDDPGLAWPTTG